MFVTELPAKMRASQPSDPLEVTRSSFIDTSKLNKLRILFQENTELLIIIDFRKFHTIHLAHMSRQTHVHDTFLNFSNKQ